MVGDGECILLICMGLSSSLGSGRSDLHWRFAKVSQFFGRMQNSVLDNCWGMGGLGWLDGSLGRHSAQLNLADVSWGFIDVLIY